MSIKKLIPLTILGVLILLLLSPLVMHNSRVAAYDNPGDATFVTDVLSGKDTSGAWVHNLYKVFRAFTDIILVIILLAVAFANILHINIDTYEIKKMLPKVIFTAVAANLALPAFTLASRIVDSLQGLTVFHPRIWDWGYIFRGVDVYQAFGTVGVIALIGMILAGGIGWIGCAIGGVIFVGAVIILILISLILSFRPYVIWLAAAIAPIAIVFSIVPQTQALFKRWLGIAVAWMFMPLFIYLIIYIGDIIPTQMGAADDSTIASIFGWFLPFILRAGLLVLAIRFPFMIEKDISSLIYQAGKYSGENIKKGGGFLMGLGPYRWQKMRERAAGLGAKSQAFEQIRNQGANGANFASEQRFINSELARRRRLPGQGNLTREQVAADIAADPNLARARDLVIRQRRDADYERFIQGEARAQGINPNTVPGAAQMAALRADVQLRARFDADFNRGEMVQFAEESATQAVTRAQAGLGRFLIQVQRANPFGIGVAIKERKELADKEWGKALTKARTPSVYSEALGRIGALKQQQAIAKEDQANIHTREDLESNMRVSFNDLVQNWMRDRGFDQNNQGDRTLAVAAIQEELRQSYINQDGAFDYLNSYGNITSNNNGLATVIEGYQRLQNLAASGSRYGTDMNEMRRRRDRAINESMGRMAGAASGSPTARSGAPSGKPVSAPSGETFTLAEKKTISLLDDINAGLRGPNAGSTPSSIEVAKLAVDRMDLSSVDPGTFKFAFAQKTDPNQTLDDVTKNLQGHGASPDEARSIADELRYSHGTNIPESVTGKSEGNPELLALAEKFQTQRLAQIGFKLRDEIGVSSFNHAEFLRAKLAKVSSPAQRVEVIRKLGEASQTVEDFETNGGRRRITKRGEDDRIKPEEYDSAREILAEGSGRSKSDKNSINAEGARKMQRGLELMLSHGPDGSERVVESRDELQIRSVLAVERDQQIIDAGEHLDDMRKKAVARKQRGESQLISSEDQLTIKERIKAVAEPQLELSYGEAWTSLPGQKKDEIISKASQVLGAISAGDEGTALGGTRELEAPVQVLVKDLVKITNGATVEQPLSNGYANATEVVIESAARQAMPQAKKSRLVETSSQSSTLRQPSAQNPPPAQPPTNPNAGSQ